MARKTRVLVVAPGRRSKGGISASVAAIMSSGELSLVSAYWVETMDDRSTIRKIASLFSAYINYLLRLPFSDLVHIHTSSGTSFYRKTLFMSLALLFRKPYVLHIHPSHFIDFVNNANGLGRSIITRFSQCAATVIALSEGTASQLKRILGVNKVDVLPNPCPYPVISNFSRDARSREILFAGKIMKAKGCFELLNAFAIVVKKIPESRLVMAGNGEVERFKRHAEELGLSNHVAFTGWIDGEALLAAYQRASILCLPSHSEGLPVSILQAMSQGVAVIATPVGGIPEIIKSGKNGILVPLNNEEALAEAILHLLENDEIRLSIGINATQTIVNNYSADIVGKKLFSIYEVIVRDKS